MLFKTIDLAAICDMRTVITFSIVKNVEALFNLLSPYKLITFGQKRVSQERVKVML